MILAITTTDLKPSGYPTITVNGRHFTQLAIGSVLMHVTGGRQHRCASSFRSPRLPSRWRRGEDAQFYAEDRISSICGNLRAPLDANGFIVIDGMPLMDVLELRRELGELFSECGEQLQTETHLRKLRTDGTNSISMDTCRQFGGVPVLTHALRTLYGAGAALVAALDGSCGVLTLPPHVQAARYKPGQYYRRHTDNMPAGESARHRTWHIRGTVHSQPAPPEDPSIPVRQQTLGPSSMCQ